MATKKKAAKKSTSNASKSTSKSTVKKSVAKSQQTHVSASETRLVREKAQDLKQLFSHVIVYVAVNAFLIFVNFVTDPSNIWFYWVLIGWGIGLAFHWLDVMNYNPINEKAFENEAKKILKK